MAETYNLIIKLTDTAMIDFLTDNQRHYQGFFKSEEDYRKAQHAENYFHPIIHDLNYDVMLHNLRFIYPNKEEAYQKIAIFDNALSFLQDMVMVEGAEVLFSKHFYDIEWNMFLEYDFVKEDMKYYRDHFIHQIRNGYLGYVLIWEIGFKKLIKDVFRKYPQYSISQFIDSCNTDGSEEFIDIVIRKTWFLAAFFHDIGYPISYSNRNALKLYKYMPYLASFSSQTKLSFTEISAKLSSSYLFKVVDCEELKSQYKKDDHGMLSALCLLFSYYDTGLIHSLKPADRCSVELAAYSIFAHTGKYNLQSEKPNNDRGFHGRPVFAENPLAFLLRLCDDLQEWQRVYMYVSDNTNTLICSDCMQTLKRSPAKDHYTCNGNGKACSGVSLQKISSFAYKKINYLAVCDDMEIGTEDGALVFSLNYNYIKQLEIIPINLDFAEYRRREIEGLKKILVNQEMFPMIEIRYFLSNNYKLLKIKIVQTFLQTQSQRKKGFLKSMSDAYKTTEEKQGEFAQAIVLLQDEILQILGHSGENKITVAKLAAYIDCYIKVNEGNPPKGKAEVENDIEHVLDNIFAYNAIYKIAIRQ